MVDGVLATFLSSLATYYGVVKSADLTGRAVQINALIEYVLALIILNLTLWYCIKYIPYDAVKEWISIVYSPFNSFLLFIIVRAGSDVFFDGSGVSTVNKLAEPIVIVAVIAMLQVVLRRKITPAKKSS